MNLLNAKQNICSWKVVFRLCLSLKFLSVNLNITESKVLASKKEISVVFLPLNGSVTNMDRIYRNYILK